MTDTPPPPDSPLYDIYYETPPTDPKPLPLRLVIIFNFIMAGMDIVYALVLVAMVFVLQSTFRVRPGIPAPPMDMSMVYLIYPTFAVVSIAAGIVKIIAAFKLTRTRPTAWHWGIAAGSINCIQIWCSLFCLAPLALGIFTLVVLCQQEVRTYLHKFSTPT